MRNRTSHLQIPRSDTLPLSHRESMVSEARSPSLNQVMATGEAQYEVHVWQSPYLLFEKKNKQKTALLLL